MVFPMTTITTRRLRLRAYTEADVDDHVAMFDHDAVRRWSTEPYPYPRADGIAWCTWQAEAARTTGLGMNWAVADRRTDRLLGVASLNHTNWPARVTEVAAVGAPWAVGRGYATEALRTIIRWVLVDQNFQRLQITAAVGNRASRLLAATCGFTQEGILRNAGHTNDGQVDLVMYGLTQADLAG
jgi:RimJ/RimL family protein N-acetyltransferase